MSVESQWSSHVLPGSFTEPLLGSEPADTEGAESCFVRVLAPSFKILRLYSQQQINKYFQNCLAESGKVQ